MNKRYKTHDKTEGQHQKGSNNTVLINKLGISSKSEMDEVELELLNLLYDDVLRSMDVNQVITSSDICEWHRKWLGNVYDWAGDFRSVNMSKDNFHFASARQVPRLMQELDRKYLSKYTPCYAMNADNLIHAIAVVHIEFILAHPFRDGNGRIVRLIVNVMALQAGFPELDFSILECKKEEYFRANQLGLSCNYEPLKKLFKQVLQNSVNAFGAKP